MAPLEILASLHDAFVHLLTALIRRSPIVMVHAIARARDGLPSGVVHERHAGFEIPGLVRRAHRRTIDLLITIDDPDGEVLFAVALEVQNSIDPKKRRIWPQVVATAELEFDADADVVVFVLIERVRRWLRRLIPHMSRSVVEVRPEHVEVVESLDRARAEPLATIFAGLYHACTDEPLEERVAGIRATLVALMNLDAAERERYGVLVSLVVPKPLIDRAKFELHDAEELTPEEARWAEDVMEFVRGNWAYGLGVEEGTEVGRRQGLEAGLRRALLDFLGLRGVELSPAGRAAIERCDDLDRLERWYERAKSAPADALAGLFEVDRGRFSPG